MIGDVLTSSILFEALRKAYPEAQLHYLIYPHTKAVVENNPFIDKLIFGKNTLPFYKLVKQIKIENYYAIIDAYSTVKTSIITSFSGANYKIGFDKKYIT